MVVLYSEKPDGYSHTIISPFKKDGQLFPSVTVRFEWVMLECAHKFEKSGLRKRGVWLFK